MANTQRHPDITELRLATQEDIDIGEETFERRNYVAMRQGGGNTELVFAGTSIYVRR